MNADTPSRLRALLEKATPEAIEARADRLRLASASVPYEFAPWDGLHREYKAAWISTARKQLEHEVLQFITKDGLADLVSLLAHAERVAVLEREVPVLRRDLAAANLEIAYESGDSKVLANAAYALDVANAVLGCGCFADDGVCIRDIYANELAEARAELAALREAVLAERERCAKIADAMQSYWERRLQRNPSSNEHSAWALAVQEAGNIASAIRSQPKKE